jgi:hypothetical protein
LVVLQLNITCCQDSLLKRAFVFFQILIQYNTNIKDFGVVLIVVLQFSLPQLVVLCFEVKQCGVILIVVLKFSLLQLVVPRFDGILNVFHDQTSKDREGHLLTIN